MSRTCKFMIIGFSCLVFMMFLVWSASDPAESRRKIFQVAFEEQSHRDNDIISPQDAYRSSHSKDTIDKVIDEDGNTSQLVGHINMEVLQSQQQGGLGEQQSQKNSRPQTFFSSLNLTFADVKLLENNSIPTEIFMNACLEMGPFMSKLGSGISMIKKEVESNLHDINRKYIQDKENYNTLQAMVLSEIKSGNVMKHHTCSRSLRWIRRMFEFISIFLEKVASGEKDLGKAGRVAYESTVSRHHNYFVRKAISAGMHLLPNYNTFLISMSVEPSDATKPNFEQIFKEDVYNYTSTLKPICSIIKLFYTDHKLQN